MAVRRYRSEAEALADAQRNVQIVSVTLAWAAGTYNCHLSPVDIVAVPGISLPLAPWVKPHWDFRLDPKRGAREFVLATVAAHGINANGISCGGLKFPRACAQCMNDSSSFQVLEAGIWVLSLPKTRFPGEFLRPKQTENLKRSVPSPLLVSHTVLFGPLNRERRSHRNRERRHTSFCAAHGEELHLLAATTAVPELRLWESIRELNGIRGVWATTFWLWLRYLGILAVPVGFILNGKYDKPWGLAAAFTGLLTAAMSYSPAGVKEIFARLASGDYRRCGRCNRSGPTKMENGKYWCSWCGDWADL